MWQLYTQLFASPYIWMAYIFEASYSAVVTSVSKKSAKKTVSTDQKSRNRRCLIVLYENVVLIMQIIRDENKHGRVQAGKV